MKLTSLTTRQEERNSWEVVAENYPNEVLSDAALFDEEKSIHVGFAGLLRPVPILLKLSQDEEFRSLIEKEGRTNSCFLFKEKQAWKDGEEISLSSSLQEKILEAVASFNDYGGTLHPDGSVTLNLLSPEIGPHYGINLLMGWREGFPEPLLTTPKSVLDSFGRGSFRARAAYQVLATRWDVRPEENGNPFNRQFYLLENGKEIFYSADVSQGVKKASCTHFPGKTCIDYELNDGLQIKRTIFLLAQKEGLPDASEVQLVQLASPTKRHLSVVFTGVFGFSAPQCQEVDVIYQTVIHQSEIIRNEKGELVALSPNYYPVYFNKSPRFVSLTSDAGFADSFSNDLTSFLGHGSLEHPEHLAHLDNALKVKGASFFALGKSFTLEENQTFSLLTTTGMVDAEKEKDGMADTLLKERIEKLYAFFPDISSFEKQLQEQEDAFRNYSSYFQVQSGDSSFDSMVNHNIPFQTLYQSFVSRAFAQTQKGYREIGFREVQDLYASIPYLVASGRQALAEELLTNWIKNVYKMGYANHNFFEVGKEPGMCSDDQLWLLPAIASYVDSTGDVSFLSKNFPMADSGERSLLDTIEAILTYSVRISIGKHGLPLLDKADWNDCLKIDVDCLDGPTKEKLYADQLRRHQANYGTPFESDLSESVMNAFLAVVALNKAIDLAALAKDDALMQKAEGYKKDLVKAIRSSCFIEGYYARVLINRKNPKNGITYVGAPGDGLSSAKPLRNGSLYLNSLSWSILSGVATEEEISSMLLLADTYLKTPSGYKLCSAEDLTLTGAKEAATSHYFPGDRENGGVFKHATMMFTRALLEGAKRDYSRALKEKMVDDAFFMLSLVYPYHSLQNPYLFKGNPRFCTQYNNSVTQENIGPILSGTATWLTLSLWEMAGFKAKNASLSFHPCLPKETARFAYSFLFQGCRYEVAVEKEKDHYAFAVASLTLNGEQQDPFTPLLVREGLKEVRILIRME